jgi:transmembrane sensor
LTSKIKELFERYQSGTATPQERELVESWFDSHSHDPSLIKEIDPEVFQDLDARMNALLMPPVKVRRLNFHWLQVAAVFVIMGVSGIFIRRSYTGKFQLPETFTEITAVKGMKKEITLKDGTTVFLNSGSSVFVSSEFGINNRTVKLAGEAFFHVHRDVTKPFIIHTGKIATTVLGTSFDINAYPEDDHIKVTVATGKVKVEGTDSLDHCQLLAKGLIHNQALVYNKVKDTHSIKISNADSISSWRSNHLNFDNASFLEIARTLSRWYGMDVELSRPAENTKRYTLSFYNERVDKVLKVLSTLTGMTYTMRGKKVIINPQNINPFTQH